MSKKFKSKILRSRRKMTSSVNPDDVSLVNKDARKERHLRLWKKKGIDQTWKAYLALYFSYLRLVFKNFSKISFKPRRFFQLNSDNTILTSRYYIKKISHIVLIFFCLGSLNTGHAYRGSDVYNDDFSDYEPGLVSFITDEEGYLVKAVPAASSGGVYLSRDELLVEHVVQKGQTLSEIAMMYGVDIQTIMWANDMWNANSLVVGKKLEIPRVDGVLYQVRKGDTVAKIAKRYSVEPDIIRKENELEGDMISIGGIILLPNAKPFNPPARPVVSRPSTPSGSTYTPPKTTYVPKPPSNNSNTQGKLLWPTMGRVTQVYHQYHHAIDIANRTAGVPIYAAKSGTITKSYVGGWGGGYGSHAKIDHGNGLVTLYAHMKVVYVKVGQKVSQGEVIGIMGSTGRSTGPHLHFEVIDNGVKRNPSAYF